MAREEGGGTASASLRQRRRQIAACLPLRWRTRVQRLTDERSVFSHSCRVGMSAGRSEERRGERV